MTVRRKARWSRRLDWLAVFGALLLVFLQGCAAPSYESSMDYRAPEEAEIDSLSGEGPAAGLYLQSRQALAAGDARRAEMILERALRIEPANPHYWHTKARMRFRQGDYSQAIELGRKSNSLAGGDRGLKVMNDSLIEEARERL